MSRRRFLYTYDIADEKRLRRVFRVMKNFGDPVQYSVFICELNEREQVNLNGRLTAELNEREDQVLIVDMGSAEGDPGDRLDYLGRKLTQSPRIRIV
ncbi:MAG TPA: CRISPR-associated endonuclease Cas2 [Spirochaetota bacterium]|nr:CRISPR-associated endonuclease Cas2 [Spirochaetota bacterium]